MVEGPAIDDSLYEKEMAYEVTLGTEDLEALRSGETLEVPVTLNAAVRLEADQRD